MSEFEFSARQLIAAECCRGCQGGQALGCCQGGRAPNSLAAFVRKKIATNFGKIPARSAIGFVTLRETFLFSI